MTYHRIKNYLACSFLVICGIILYFIKDIRIRDIVFIEFFSYLFGVMFLSYFLFFTKNKYAKNIDKSIWNLLLLFTSPFVISFLFLNIAGSYLIINEIPDGMSTSSMNSFVSLIFIPSLIMFLYLFRHDKIVVKKIVFVATLYMSALINRILLYVIDGIFNGMLLIEIISIVSTLLLYVYISFTVKYNSLSNEKKWFDVKKSTLISLISWTSIEQWLSIMYVFLYHHKQLI